MNGYVTIPKRVVEYLNSLTDHGESQITDKSMIAEMDAVVNVNKQVYIEGISIRGTIASGPLYCSNEQDDPYWMLLAGFMLPPPISGSIKLAMLRGVDQILVVRELAIGGS